MNSFTETLLNLKKISAETRDSLLKRIVEKTITKGSIIQRQGQINKNIYFVKKGLLRSYSISKNGKEHTYMFAPEGWIMADGTSEKEPAGFFIEALEDSNIEMINREVFLEDYIKATSENEIKQSHGLMRRVSVLQKRVIMLMSASAIERYEHFIQTYPQILKRVPQKMIASYLGITPEALSKVKNQRK